MLAISYSQAQEGIKVTPKDRVKLDADKFIGVNMFDELFYVKKEVLYKKVDEELYSYQNRLLGAVSSVDVLNSLETTLFYQTFNAVIQLDRRLGEISKIDFNQSNSFSIIKHVSVASNKRLWVFNTDIRQLQVYNPKQDIVEASSQSISEVIIAVYSNYNFCWVLTKNSLLQYNIYGNLLNSYALEGYDTFVYYKNNFILKREEQLYSLPVGGVNPEIIELSQFRVKDFSVTNETLYIYDGKELHSFKINTNKE